MYSEIPEKQQAKWSENLQLDIHNWNFIYKLPFICTNDNKLIIFQYKILHRILCTN